MLFDVYICKIFKKKLNFFNVYCVDFVVLNFIYLVLNYLIDLDFDM